MAPKYLLYIMKLKTTFQLMKIVANCSTEGEQQLPVLKQKARLTGMAK
jgi:hypothetical protein